MDELRLSDGPIEAVVLPEVGARLHRLRAFGHDLLRSPDDPAVHARDPFFWGAYVMAPWCNRIDAGPLTVGGRRVAVGSNFGDGSAIHGQVYARPWERRGDGTLGVRAGGDGWPWEYEVTLRIEVASPALRLGLTLVNRASDAMPAGLGIHPWFRRPVLMAIRADAVYASNAAADADCQPVSGPFDRRQVGEMAPGLDATWTRLAEPPVELRWVEAGIRATIHVDAPDTYIVAASPPELGAIAVEPQTHAPHGLRRLLDGAPGGLVRLEPGGALRLDVELVFERLTTG